MRDYEKEFTDRVAFIRQLLAESGAAGIVYGNSGGKDSALVGILCKAACENTVGLLLPCTSKRNYAEDRADAETVAAQYRIETRTVDLTPVKAAVTVWPISQEDTCKAPPRTGRALHRSGGRSDTAAGCPAFCVS